MALTHEQYCTQVCGAKCCKYLNPDRACPKLKPDNRCGIYNERYKDGAPEFVTIGWYNSGRVDDNGLEIIKPFVCGMIEKMIERKELPDEIEKQCSYAHPELLKGNYGTEINS